MELISKIHKGRYGFLQNEDCVLVTQIKINNNNNNLTPRQIIFNVDVSGSMESSIPKLKSSLLSFRDVICGISHTDMEDLGPIGRDILFRSKIDFSLVTFSSNASLIWSSKKSEPDILFENIVNEIYAKGCTNVWDGLSESLAQVDENKATWVITMADGYPNEGLYQNARGIYSAINPLPKNTKMVSLGYGNNFNAELLEAIGTFSYVESEEKIPGIFGSLAAEISDAVSFGGYISYPNIIPEDSRTIVGSEEVIVGCENQCYTHVILLPKNINPDELIGLTVKYKYFDITNNDPENTIQTNILDGNDINSEIRKLYYEASMGRLALGLYKSMINSKNLKHQIISTEERLNMWKDPESLVYKETLLRIISDLNNYDFGTNEFITFSNRINALSTECKNRSGLTDIGGYRTNRQKYMTTQSEIASNIYMNNQ